MAANCSSFRFPRVPTFLILFAVILAASASAKEKDIQGLAEKVGDSLREAKLRKVVVADFVTSDGTVTPMGRFLAARVSDVLRAPKKGYEVVPMSELRNVLDGRTLETKEALQKDYPINIAGVAGAVVTGRIEEDSQRARLSVDVVDVIAGKLIGQAEAVSPYVPVLTPGKGNVSYPQCLHCPVPQYTDEARSKRIEGTVVLQAVITPEGRATQITVIKMAGHGLDEQAIAAVRTWKLKPAMKDGNPVAVRTPVEVTFRLK